MGTPSDLAVRLVWAYLRILQEQGDDQPLDWSHIRKELAALKAYGVPIPEGDEWWR